MTPLSVRTRGTEIRVSKRHLHPVATAALFPVAKARRLSNCPLAGKWIKSVVCTHTEQCSVKKTVRAATWRTPRTSRRVERRTRPADPAYAASGTAAGTSWGLPGPRRGRPGARAGCAPELRPAPRGLRSARDPPRPGLVPGALAATDRQGRPPAAAPGGRVAPAFPPASRCCRAPRFRGRHCPRPAVSPCPRARGSVLTVGASSRSLFVSPGGSAYAEVSLAPGS